jgi:hypothetical protein
MVKMGNLAYTLRTKSSTEINSYAMETKSYKNVNKSYTMVTKSCTSKECRTL